MNLQTLGHIVHIKNKLKKCGYSVGAITSEATQLFNKFIKAYLTDVNGNDLPTVELAIPVHCCTYKVAADDCIIVVTAYAICGITHKDFLAFNMADEQAADAMLKLHLDYDYDELAGGKGFSNASVAVYNAMRDLAGHAASQSKHITLKRN